MNPVITVTGTDPSQRAVLYTALNHTGLYTVHVEANPARAGIVGSLVVEHAGSAVRIYRPHSAKARAAALSIPCPPLNLNLVLDGVAKRVHEIVRHGQHRHALDNPTEIVHGPGSPLIDVLRLVKLFGPQPDPVLVGGETGTGKELIVRELHQLSNRREKPLMIVNCACLAELLLESELFGHERGSFTGACAAKIGMLEEANGGTAVLDEINSTPLAVQAKLLRFLQNGEIRRVGANKTQKVNVRCIATTNVPLPRLIQEGRFRSDLYYRLAAFTIEVPPLRARAADIPYLVRSFCARSGHSRQADWVLEHLPKYRLPGSEAMQIDWPGNVRELEKTVRRALIIGQPAAKE
jgi:transcriptional regulator with GAF, ATPase, and Fis domain